MSNVITIAVSKGRIFKETLPLLSRLDIRPADDPETSRKLVLQTNRENIRIIIIRATDVPTYVEYGAADLGIAGKDVLMEYSGDSLYEPLDLGIAKCKMMLAGPVDSKEVVGRPRVATKYVNITRNFFADQGRQVEIIKLYGSMELAPLLGLSDWIVDLVDTGSTLKANGMVLLESIMDISSRLIVNKAAMKMKHSAIKPMIDQMTRAVSGKYK
ncbi:MAG: ATP phosphoribosyltransferase [Gammaproteobacteria bacterium]